jgi:hypothetical protein
MHDRLRPARNRFVYPVFCVRVDIDAMPSLRRWWFGVDRTRLVSLHTRDYGPRDGSSLGDWIRRVWRRRACPTTDRSGCRPRRVCSATPSIRSASGIATTAPGTARTGGRGQQHLWRSPRLSGDRAGPGADPRTPCLPRASAARIALQHRAGTLRVSYTRNRGTAYVGIDYYDDDGLLLRTSIGGRKGRTLRRMLAVLAAQPWAIAVIVRIHWQAVRLWWRSVPFHGKHPPSAPPVELTLSRHFLLI